MICDPGAAAPIHAATMADQMLGRGDLEPAGDVEADYEGGG